SGVNGYVSLWDYTTGVGGILTSSVIQQDSTNNTLGVKVAPDINIALAIAADTTAVALKTGVSIVALGSLPTTNKALSLHAANAVTNNIALEIVSGDFTQALGNVAFGGSINPLLRVSVVTNSSIVGLNIVNTFVGTTALGIN